MKVNYHAAEVQLSIQNRIVGGIPTDPAMIEGWIKSKCKELSKEEQEKLAATTASQLPEVAEEAAKSMWTTFKRDEKGIYIEGRQVKAALKEAANVLREALIKENKIKDEGKSRFTNLKARLAERLWVVDDIIYLRRNGEVLTKADGLEERAIHVMTRTGPRSAFKRYDYVNSPCQVKFTLEWLFGDGIVDPELLENILTYAGKNGLGADRSQGNGKFSFEMRPLASAG